MGCAGCTRRTVLRGLGAAAVLGCGGGGDGLPAIDAPTGTPCGTDQICLDLTMTPYTALAEIGRSIRIAIGTDYVIVIRVTDAMVVALSDVCTHQRCAVGYSASAMLLECPCHGSEFRLTGAVVRGPATRPLRSYPTAFDPGTQIVTITTA
jgi:Rieske Fe-S protein